MSSKQFHTGVKKFWQIILLTAYCLVMVTVMIFTLDVDSSPFVSKTMAGSESFFDNVSTIDNLTTVSTSKRYLLPQNLAIVQSSTANCSFIGEILDTDVIISTDIFDFNLYKKTEQVHGFVQLIKDRELPHGKVFNADLSITWANSHLNFSETINTTVYDKMLMGLELCDLAKYRLDSIRCMNKILSNAIFVQLDESLNTTGSWEFIDEIFVLHYKKNPERLNHMRQLLSQFNASSKIVKDFDRDEITREMIDCVYPLRPVVDQRSWQTSNLTIGEISLSMKHFAAFDMIVKNKIEYALIFEDDVVLDDTSKDFVESFRNAMLDLPTDYDIYFVGGCLDLHCKKTSGTIEAPKACLEINRSRCTHAYVISYRGALKTFKNLPIRWPIDWLMNSEGIGLKTYHAEPPIFLQGKTFSSTGIRGAS